MKRKHRDLDIFSLSFLDIISCGFGAVVILVLISSNSTMPLPESKGEVTLLLHQVLLRTKSFAGQLQEAPYHRKGTPLLHPSYTSVIAVRNYYLCRLFCLSG